MKRRQTKRTQNANLLSEPSLIFGFKHNLSRDFKENFTQSSRETINLSHEKGILASGIPTFISISFAARIGTQICFMVKG